MRSFDLGVSQVGWAGVVALVTRIVIIFGLLTRLLEAELRVVCAIVRRVQTVVFALVFMDGSYCEVLSSRVLNDLLLLHGSVLIVRLGAFSIALELEVLLTLVDQMTCFVILREVR